MLKVIMLLSITTGPNSATGYTISGFESIEECKASQKVVASQYINTRFIDANGRSDREPDTVQTRVKTKCIEL